jgi:hypothetical protein
MHTRYCVECEEEFRPEIVHCSDCGALLEDRDEDGSGVTPEPSPDAEPASPSRRPPEGYVRVFDAVDVAAVRKAAARLAAAGLTFHVSGNSAGYDLLVPPEDGDAAIQVLRGRKGAVSRIPESESAAGDARCPACGTGVPAGAAECPECQLVVGDGADGDPD